MDEQPVAMEESSSYEPNASKHIPSTGAADKSSSSERLGRNTVKHHKKKRKRRRRRGRGKLDNDKNSVDDNQFTVLHSNVRSVHSKLSSLNAISSALNPSVITLNETNLKGKKKLNLNGYKSFNRNRETGNIGGVSTSVANNLVDEVLKVSEGKEGNEYIITRHSQFSKPLNIINIYGDVESRTPLEIIEARWEEIMQEIVKIEARGECLLVIGDLNRHLHSELVISEKSNKRESHGGKLVREFLESEKYVLINGTDLEVNGPYTRYDPKDPNDDSKKSVIDLVIVSKCLVNYIVKLEIDKYLQWTPCRKLSSDTVIIILCY